MSEPRTTDDLSWMRLINAMKAVFAIQRIESCRRAIEQYAEMGISGTDHDLEHRQMLAEAISDFRSAVP